MKDFFEIDELKKTIKTLNLDDLSIDDLVKYIQELNDEIERANIEIERKKKFLKDADQLFR